MTEYRPRRIGEDLPDFVFFSVDATPKPPRIVIDRDLRHRAPCRIPSGDVLEFG